MSKIFNLADFPLWTALVTPLTESGDVDFPCLTTLVAQQAEAGNGIVLLGSTGEGLALTTQEQLELVAHVCQLSPHVPIMVAVGGFNLASQIAWIKQCNDLPIHGYLLASPLYAKPGVVGQTEWFNALLDQAAHPCMLYNVPSRSGVSLSTAALATLQHHPRCWALKEASGNIDSFLAYRKHCPKIELFSGEDGLMPYLASAGAKGLVSVCANAWPQATNLYVKRCLSGQLDGLFPLWRDAVDSLFQVANPIPVKVLMHHQKSINTPFLRAPLTHKELLCQQGVLAADQNINQWLTSSQTSKI